METFIEFSPSPDRWQCQHVIATHDGALRCTRIAVTRFHVGFPGRSVSRLAYDYTYSACDEHARQFRKDRTWSTPAGAAEPTNDFLPALRTHLADFKTLTGLDVLEVDADGGSLHLELPDGWSLSYDTEGDCDCHTCVRWVDGKPEVIGDGWQAWLDYFVEQTGGVVDSDEVERALRDLATYLDSAGHEGYRRTIKTLFSNATTKEPST